MKTNILKSISVFFLSSILLGCNPNANKQKNTIEITLTDSLINQMQAGIGANFTTLVDSLPVVQLNHQYRSYGGSCWGANPPLTDTASWNKIWHYADWMGLDFCRVLTSRKCFELQQGKYTFDNEEMKMLYHYLDYCESRGIDVFLQNLWNNVTWLSVPTAGNDPVKILRSAPNDIEVYTEGLMQLLNHLVNTKKYTCVKYVCIINEPFENWSWYIAKFDPDSFATPAPAYKLMQEKLHKSNLDVKLSGPDVSVYYSSKIHPNKSSFFEYFDAYDIHSYVTRPDWYADSTMTFEDGGKGELNKISLTEIQYAAWKNHGKEHGNKPFFISEMGSFMHGFGEDTIGMSTYEAMLKDVESVIRYSNIGVDGFMRWSFLNRGNLDGKWQFVNSWNIKENKFLPAQQITPHTTPYYMWSMLTRFTPKHAKVMYTKVNGGSISGCQRVFAATYKNSTSTNYSLIIINDSDSTFATKVNVKGNNQQLFKYHLVKNTLGENIVGEVSLRPTETDLSKEFEVPAKSIIVFTNYNLKEYDAGIILQ